jgi:hypothetical protein
MTTRDSNSINRYSYHQSKFSLNNDNKNKALLSLKISISAMVVPRGVEPRLAE